MSSLYAASGLSTVDSSKPAPVPSGVQPVIDTPLGT